MRLSTMLTLGTTAIALGAIAVWPLYTERAANAAHAASLPTMAPVTADYEQRGKLVAAWERAVNEHHRGDMLSPRILADQYLQRYRETGDIADVFRSERMAKLSLAAQPKYNVQADSELAAVDLTLHKFHDALRETRFIESYDRVDPQIKIREASLDLEIGDYAGAKTIVDRLKPGQPYAAIAQDTLQTRYDELTGNLARARRTFERPTAYDNAQFDLPAQQRAWFYFRTGELAFEAGDNEVAIAAEETAKTIFPNDVDATRAEARFTCALHRYRECLTNAVASANVIPYPETLGYEADAQRALGDAAAAKRTDDLIVTIERIGNAQRISDRLLAIYYSEHRIHTADAYRIARRELAVRDDIFTEDTLAWAAAMDGRWNEARVAIRKAIRFDTENSLLQYHAGVIADRFGDRAEARKRFARALALNAQFHAQYADDARARLAILGS